MSDQVTGELGLPPIDQVSYVVRDMEKALERFEPMFGEFMVIESKLDGTTYRGRQSDITLKIAFGRSGGLEIELIEPVAGDSPHREFLDAHGEGQHHVRCQVDAVAPVVERARALGFEEIWSHELPGSDIRWSYVEREGTVLELIEGMPALTPS